MKKLTVLPPDLAGIANLPPTAGITGTCSGVCTEKDLACNTETLLGAIKARKPVNEFSRIFTHVSARHLLDFGYRPDRDDSNLWVWRSADQPPRKLSEELPDGRYIVDPSAIGWSDIDRFNSELKLGPAPSEDTYNFIARCLRMLMRTPTPKDAQVMSYRKAVDAMLKGSTND